MSRAPGVACIGFAERRLGRTTFPIEPRNTLSNAAYLLVGWLVWEAIRTPEAVVFAASCSYLGLTSGGYHGFGGRLWQAMDWSGMLGLFAVLAAWLLLAPFASELPVPLWVIMAGVGLGAATLLPFHFQQVGKNTLIGLLLVLSLVPAYFNGDATLTLASLAVFAAAKGVWLLDWHSERLGYWGHAVWHVLTAVAIGLLFLAQAVAP